MDFHELFTIAPRRMDLEAQNQHQIKTVNLCEFQADHFGNLVD